MRCNCKNINEEVAGNAESIGIQRASLLEKLLTIYSKPWPILSILESRKSRFMSLVSSLTSQP